MLSGVLRSSIAIEINIRIMRAFVAMRRVLANVEPLLSRIESVERRQITDQSKNEARFDEIFAKMGAEDIPLQSIFYQNKFWDAKSLLIKVIRRAKKELIVIDAYPGVATEECCHCGNVASGQFQFPMVRQVKLDSNLRNERSSH